MAETTTWYAVDFTLFDRPVRRYCVDMAEVAEIIALAARPDSLGYKLVSVTTEDR